MKDSFLCSTIKLVHNTNMKKIITWFNVFVLLANLASSSYAQVIEDFKPSSVNQLGKEYPQVNSEGRVRARIYAPGGQKSAA